MAKGYKPDRPVTSEKLRLEFERLFKLKHPNRWCPAAAWKRMSKHRLPESRGWVRGYMAHGTGPNTGANEYHAIAVTDENDTQLLKIYLCDDWKQESQSMGVLEVMFKDD